jgi:hypothetical protein
MERNAMTKPANAHYTYGQVETALAAVFGIDAPGQRGWLRGRLQHMRRLGLVAASPGRGRTIDYAQEDLDRWLVAVELEHFGIDPAKVVQLIKQSWNPPPRKRSTSEAFDSGEAWLRDLVAVARESRSAGSDVIVSVQFGPMSASPVVGYTTVNGMNSLGQWLNGDRLDRAPRRTSVFNLSSRLRALDQALTTASAPKPPRPTGLAAKILRAAKKARGEL